jgi:hypothetical protein
LIFLFKRIRKDNLHNQDYPEATDNAELIDFPNSLLTLQASCFVPFLNGTTFFFYLIKKRKQKKSRLSKFFLWVPKLLPCLRNQTRSRWSLKQDCSTSYRSRQKLYPIRKNFQGQSYIEFSP